MTTIAPHSKAARADRKAAATIPAPYRKASRVAQEISLQAGELYNSIIDGQHVSVLQVRELSTLIVSVNTKRKSIVDSSTGQLFFDAARHVNKAVDALFENNAAAAALQLDLAATAMDKVPAHVQGLFTR